LTGSSAAAGGRQGDDEGGSSSVSSDATYRGSDPLSEQETKNVAHVLKTHHATAVITHHTSGDLLLWPWGDTKADAADNDVLEGLGRAMAVYNRYRPQKSRPTGVGVTRRIVIRRGRRLEVGTVVVG